MEETLEVVKDEKENVQKRVRINGITLWRIITYFIIYSFLGYIVDTLYGVYTKGLLESRQSFLYGPFCGVYGLGAVVMIVALHKFGKKYNMLFLGGFIVGSIVEYCVSLFGEMILGVKWWDYSGMPFNINGRICVYFSIFWGFLGLYLLTSLNPKIDRFIEWMKVKVKNEKIMKTIILVFSIFLIIDCIITIFAMDTFLTRVIVENNIEVSDIEEVQEKYEKIYSNENLSDFIYTFWGNKKMIKTFPNIKITGKDENIIYVDSLVDIQPYILKVYDVQKAKEDIQKIRDEF